MERGATLAASALAMPAPPAPYAPGAPDLGSFWRSLERWTARREQALDAARRALDEAAEESLPRRVVGGAIVGLMYEDVARQLAHIPSPRALEGEPEIAEVYRATLEGRARRYLEHARRAYSACAQNAVGASGMRTWSHFCAGREDALPEPDYLASGLASGETSVEVIAN